MSLRISLFTSSLIFAASTIFGATSARPEPLDPLSPAEVQYLEHARRVFAASHDPVAFRSDGRLLADGRYACEYRDAGFVGTQSTAVPAVLTQLAFIYLCPA